MPEEVLFETEQRASRTEVAEHLRRVATNLEAGNSLELESGGDNLT